MEWVMSDETKNTGHTPGPFEVEDRFWVEEYGDRFVIVAGPGRDRVAITSLRGAPNGDVDVARANADLFAAAPDLLAACQSTVWLLEMMVGIGRFPGNAEELRECKAAIAKAEGR